MSRLFRLPNGSGVSPRIVTMVDARGTGRHGYEAAGRTWPALVVVETDSGQVIRCGCHSLAEAESVRDELMALISPPLIDEPQAMLTVCSPPTDPIAPPALNGEAQA